MSWRDIELSTLELSVRCKGVLCYGVGLKTLGEVDEKSDAELLRWPGMGPKTLEEIRAVIAHHKDGHPDLSAVMEQSAKAIMEAVKLARRYERERIVAKLRAMNEEIHASRPAGDGPSLAYSCWSGQLSTLMIVLDEIEAME